MAYALKFFYNGIKDVTADPAHTARAVLQTCFYSDSELKNYPVGTITIYAREYCYADKDGMTRGSGFSAGIKEAFKVENDTEIMTDYFEKDRIRVTPDHPLFLSVQGAMEKDRQRYIKRVMTS